MSIIIIIIIIISITILQVYNMIFKISFLSFIPAQICKCCFFTD